MKKFLTVLLVGCITLSMTACGEKKTDETTKAETTIETTEEVTESTIAETTTEETTAAATDATTAETTDASDASEVELNAGQTEVTITDDSDITAILTPEGATLVTDASGAIILTSTDTYENVTSFYKDAIEALGAEGEEVDASAAQDILGDIAAIAGVDGADVWTWVGTYKDGKDLTIAVTDITGVINITIQY